VLAPQQQEAEHVVEQIAAERGAPLVKVGRDWLYAPGGRDLTHQSLHIWSAAEQPLMDAFVESAGGEEWVPPRYDIPLLGHHQVVNAAVAYAALRVLREGVLALPEESVQRGFRQVQWPGRFQVLSTNPAVVIDSAHNRDSALKLRLALDDTFGQPVTLTRRLGRQGHPECWKRPQVLADLARRSSAAEPEGMAVSAARGAGGGDRSGRSGAAPGDRARPTGGGHRQRRKSVRRRRSPGGVGTRPSRRRPRAAPMTVWAVSSAGFRV
jgi:hypothetical protein